MYIFVFAGESGLGKSTLINSMFLTDLYSAEYPGPSHRIKKTVDVSAGMGREMGGREGDGEIINNSMFLADLRVGSNLVLLTPIPIDSKCSK